MSWPYADLSKNAKVAGGPEKYLEMIEEGGKEIGRAEGQAAMLFWLSVTAVGASMLTATVMTVINHFKTKKAIAQKTVEQAKAELIQGIKEYDTAHADEQQEDEDVESSKIQ